MKRIHDVQRQVLEICGEAHKVRLSLVQLYTSLEPGPEGEDWDEMANEKIAPSITFHVHSILAGLETETFREVSHALLDAAFATRDKLRLEWETAQKHQEELAREREAARGPEPP